MQKFIVLLLFPILVQAQKFKEIYTPEEVKEDMAFLKKRFEKIHPGMYFYTGREAYKEMFDSLYNSIDKPLNYLETFRILSVLVTKVKDGHTNLRYDKNRFKKKNAKFVPFYLRKIGEKFYLALNYSRDSTIIRGSEVLTFNDISTEQLIEKFKTLVSSDNDNQQVKEYYTTGAFPTYFKRYYGEVDSIKICYRLPNIDSVFCKKVACMTNAEILKIDKKRYKNLNRANLSLKLLDSANHIAKLDITEFMMKATALDFRQQKFKRVLNERFKTIKQLKVEHLIIDFRANGGGYIPNISRLLKYLSPTPFTLVDTLAFKKKAYFSIFRPYYLGPPIIAWLGFPKRDGEFMYRVNKKNDKQKPNKSLSFKGKTYFITDPGCYSATTFTLNLAKDLGIPEKIIGQQVGGATWGSFAVDWSDFKLPNTKFIVHTPLIKINHKLPNKANKNFFLQPDYEVNRNRDELLKNNTSVVDFTVEMIRKSEIQKRQ
ncbi:peptidase S41 [Emticicia oligotrophica DSM 17448]|uniref:Peptidase S41 n=1 Tax=Emticicia oligotrophica (strain DSM 17448 / CIP 109782 / MTCC 6937 / GPTSA100-15) TaxID=929562 RepID=A0ABN4ACE2_EMTOG|nr:S41 family peptidase [Emticicia oligotrophica]AFK01905.1 peptidase S41 [Emticicia oligotrophica DSM 17448]